MRATRRAPIVLGATVAGVVAILSYQPHSQPASRRPQPAGIVVSTPPRAAPTGGRATKPVSFTATSVGADAPNQYGDVQVRIKVSGQKIVSVDAVALPGGDSRSQEISAVAGPLLRQQALAAQSASIDGVSGASFTSDGYRQSLQSALDGLPPAQRPA
jgi:uncharacterized protein with FMN-binding domain